MTVQEKKDRILRTIARLDAHQAVQNLVGRLVVAFNFRQPERVLEAFATGRDDIWFEYADEGRFTGAAAVEALVGQLIGGPARPGELRDHQLTTPIVEVADDGASARAVWWVVGAGALVQDGQDPDAIWDWGSLAADLVPTADGWKLLHLHWFRTIRCLYVDGWTDDTSLINRPNTPLHPLATATSYHNPYHPLSIRDGIPAAPRPYTTADDGGWMLSRDKTR